MNRNALTTSALLLAAVATLSACHSSGSGSTAPAPAGGAAARAANALPAAVTPANIALGDSIFHARGCRNCHGPDAKGRANGPDLTSGKFQHVNGSVEDFARIITTGVPLTEIKDKAHTRAMPARGGGRPAPLSDAEITAVAAYIWSLNHK